MLLTMKRANKLVAPALFAIGVVAQSGSSILGSSTIIVNPSDTGVVYATYSICPTTEVTITGPTMTCPGPYCTRFPTNDPGAGQSTVWVTELINVCPTATDEAGWLTTMTTTITEACPCSEETRAPGYVPAGYTTAVHTCTVCGQNSPVATIITPITTAGAYAAAATAGVAAGAAGPGSSSPVSGSEPSVEASAYATTGANAASNYGTPGSGPGSNAQSSVYAAAGVNSGVSSPNGAASPGSSNAADYAPQGAGSNSSFTLPMSPSAGSGMGGSMSSGISPPITMQSHSGAGRRHSFDAVGTIFVGVAGLVGGLAWQL
jgi:hypothetical protein